MNSDNKTYEKNREKDRKRSGLQDAESDGTENVREDVKTNGKEKRTLKRYEFDNSAKFYPVIANKKAQSLYCMGAVLDFEVDPEVLARAVNDVMVRFPSLKVRIKKGYSWHYLEENTEEVKVFPIDGVMLRPIDPKLTNGYWFRVSYGGNKVKVDMFHGLTDGNGALSFLKSVLFRYQELKGVKFENPGDVMDWRETPVDGETEDSFFKYYKHIKFGDIDLKTMAGGEPLRLRGTPVDNGYLTTLGRAKASDIVANAKAEGVSFTAYVAGIIAYTIASLSEQKKPIVMMIPVNLRNMFPSKTMRNFVTFVRIVIKPDSCKTLEDYIKASSEQLTAKSSKSEMEAFISTTVRAQGNVILKCLPLFLKSFFVNLGRKMMRSRQTIIFSNLGRIKVPEELGLERFIFHMNVSKYNPQNVGAVTIGDYVTFAFTRAIKETTLTDAFFKNLKSQGVEVEIDEELSSENATKFYETDSLHDDLSPIK